jgi:hypothetical protein
VNAKKKELQPQSKIQQLLRNLAAKNSDIETSADMMHNIRYLDFCDPKTGLPTLSQEWFIGARGYIAGRVVQLRATYSKGKSSYMYLQYGSAQKKSNAFCFHIETEGAPMPPDRVKAIGANPNELLQTESNSLDDALSRVDTLVCEIRGGFGGSAGELGRNIKTKFTEPVDADCECPILIGIDSLSALASEKEADQDIIDIGKVCGIGNTARAMRTFFKSRVQRFRTTQTALFLSTQETVKIETGVAAFSGPKKTSVAAEAIGIYSTFGIDFGNATRWYDKSKGIELGDILHLTTFKNKWSPRYRNLDLYLTQNNGFDLIHTDADFLLNSPCSPFKSKQYAILKADGEPYECYKHAHGITCTALRDKTQPSFSNEEEFVRALYDNEDLLMTIREKMRIRGFGHDWEKNYEGPEDMSEQESEDEKPRKKPKDFVPDDFDKDE